jgi:hypothetical protein
MYYNDRLWINKVSPYLNKFAWKTETLANFRCPICGDSSQNDYKARGYFYMLEGNWLFKCHNCNAGMSFGRFIKEEFPLLYKEYSIEKFKESGGFNKRNKKVDEVDLMKAAHVEMADKTEEKEYATKLSELPKTHTAVKYVKSRKVNDSLLDRILYTENYSKLIKDCYKIKKYQDRVLPEKECIAFELINREGIQFGCQARGLSEKLFSTIKWNESMPSLYGLDKNDKDKMTFCFEAIFCSLMVPNSVAMLGASVNSEFDKYLDKNKTILVFDNEPRHKHTVKRMEKAIELGWKIAFWESGFPHKDLNDAVKAGERADVIARSLYNNSEEGLKASIKLAQWKKI